MSIGVNFCEIYIHCIGATPSYSTGGVNQMWILQEIYKDMLEDIESRSLPTFTSNSLSKRLESQIIKTIWEQVSRRPKQDRLRVQMPGGDLSQFKHIV